MPENKGQNQEELRDDELNSVTGGSRGTSDEVPQDTDENSTEEPQEEGNEPKSDDGTEGKR